jgi:hypothetical protein
VSCSLHEGNEDDDANAFLWQTAFLSSQIEKASEEVCSLCPVDLCMQGTRMMMRMPFCGKPFLSPLPQIENASPTKKKKSQEVLDRLLMHDVNLTDWIESHFQVTLPSVRASDNRGVRRGGLLLTDDCCTTPAHSTKICLKPRQLKQQ